jgi:hypothetical protein
MRVKIRGVCTLMGCDLPHTGRGFCHKHLYRWKRYGDPNHPQTIAVKGSGTLRSGYRVIAGRLEHRIVMEGILGRPLTRSETVHHINGVRSDNRPENLELWVRQQPKGQRVQDKITYAQRVLVQYEGTMKRSPETSLSASERRPLRPQHVYTFKETEGECRMGDCCKYPKHRGFCRPHYRKLVREGVLTTVGYTARALCSEPDCGRVHQAKGLCEYHYNQSRGVGIRARTRRPNGTGTITADGYKTVGSKGKHMLEHRSVMEQLLGRALRTHENVHHKNGDRLDNRPENLELWSTSQPAGQRVEDLVVWAREILMQYEGDTVSYEHCTQGR